MSISKGQRFLGIAFFLTLAFCIVEFIGGKISGSLALIADAFHMLTDVAAIGIALFAGWIARRHATRQMTYGFYRVEILSALINGSALLVVAVLIVREAWERFHSTPEILAPLMIAVATMGLAINLINLFLLKKVRKESINIKGAFLHIVSDTLGSVGAIIAGITIAATGWHWVDPAVSCVIATLILFSAGRLLKDVVEVLLEAAPSHIDMEALEKSFLVVPGVESIHDLHVWSITSGRESLSAHVRAEKGADPDEILKKVNEMLNRDFNIQHTTIQVESSESKIQDHQDFHP